MRNSLESPNLLPFTIGKRQRALCRDIDSKRERLDHRGVVPRKWTGKLRRDLEAESVAASTRIEGVQVTDDDVRRIFAGDKPDTVSELDAELVRGYREAIGFAQRRADDEDFAWTAELVLGIHDRVSAGSRAMGAGKFRKDDGVVLRDRASGEVVFRPAGHQLIPLMIDTMCVQANEAGWHPAIASAWVHVALAAIHPFPDGNGRTARALASLAMYRGGFKSQTFTSLEEWWGRHPDRYYRSFACLGETFDTKSDVTSFVDNHLTQHIAQIAGLDARNRTYGKLWLAMENVLHDAGLPDRIVFALWDAFHGRTVTSVVYRSNADVAPPTATNDFRVACAAQLLAARGAGRGRHYVPGLRLISSVARELGISVDSANDDATRNIIADQLSAEIFDEIAKTLESTSAELG